MKPEIKHRLGWLVACVFLVAAAVVPIQSNFFTSPNYAGTTAATARTYLGLGSIAPENTNAFMRTNQQQVFNVTNAIGQLAASNLWASNLVMQSTSPTTAGSLAYTNGALFFDYPRSTYYLFNNLQHGGGSDGTEIQWQYNQMYMGPADGAHLQIGLGTQHRIVQYMQYAQADIGTPNAHKGQSHQFGFRYAYDIAPTYASFAIPQWNINATNYDDATGHAKLIVWSPKTLLTTSGDVEFGTNMFNWDTKGFTEMQSLRKFHYEPSHSGTNIVVTLLKDSQAFILATNANVTLSDVAVTNESWTGDIKFYSPFGNVAIAFPSGWSWLSESGLAVSPTNVAGSNVLRVAVTYDLGTVTNILATYRTGTYTPFVDPDAAAFIASASITAPTEKAAVNQLVLDLKAASLWTKLYALYPFLGGTSNTCSWNLVNTASFRIGWPTPPTFNANGITGNGTDMYGDTHFKPSANGTLNSAGVYVYCRTTLPTAGGSFIKAVSSTGGDSFHGIARSGANLAGSGLNINNQTSVALAASDFRGNLGFWRTSSTVQIIAVNTTHTSGNATATGVNVAENLTLLARKWETFSPDEFSNANLAAAAISQGFTDAEITSFYTIMTAFQTTLGRQAP